MHVKQEYAKTFCVKLVGGSRLSNILSSHNAIRGLTKSASF